MTAMPAPAPTLSLAVQYAVQSAGIPDRSQFRRWLQAAFDRPVQLGLRLVDEAEGRALNRDYRGKDYATNVLTFVYGEDPSGVLSGDLVLCVPVVEREAMAAGRVLRAHYCHLVMHGALHLSGHDHESVVEAEAMERREITLLARFGYPDPYAEG